MKCGDKDRDSTGFKVAIEIQVFFMQKLQQGKNRTTWGGC